MSKKDRQLTPAEQKRKVDFEIICEAMEIIPLNSE